MSYFTVRQFAQRNQAFSEPSMRSMIYDASPNKFNKGKVNGLIEAGAIIRIGHKVIINEDRFFAWVTAQQVERNKDSDT